MDQKVVHKHLLSERLNLSQVPAAHCALFAGCTGKTLPGLLEAWEDWHPGERLLWEMDTEETSGLPTGSPGQLLTACIILSIVNH